MNITTVPSTVELLAPVGKWDVLETVIANGADAVYLGGKKLNMRMWRSEFNFSDEALQDAVAYAHERGKKVYVTVNNLYFTDELNELAAYLESLHQMAVDALIVQDMAVPYLCQQLGLNMPLHVSVQANTHSIEGVKALQAMGISRVIISKGLSLEEVYQLRQATGVEIEYFIHGDICVAQTGLCYTSSLIFGESSNRGRCMKPCRWTYDLIDRQGRRIDLGGRGRYLLANKDLCLYPFIPELIQAGICSFKIEGRMREAAYLGPIVRAYREAIDRYLADPAGYRLNTAVWREMIANRARDFSSCYAFKHPGEQGIGYSGEREPKFPTRPIPHPTISLGDVEQLANSTGCTTSSKPVLAVRVGTREAAARAVEAGAEMIYVGGEVPTTEQTGWGERELREAIKLGHQQGCQVVVTTPQITTRRELHEFAYLLSRLSDLEADGVMVGNWGTLYLASQMSPVPIYTDYSLNVTNTATLDLLRKRWRVTQVTVSLELASAQVAPLASEYPVELVVHGQIAGMVMDYCLPGALLAGSTKQDPCPRPCQDMEYFLRDDCGQDYRIVADQYCRNHLLMPFDLCLLPYLPEWSQFGLASVRIEGQYYDAETVGRLTRIYRHNLDRLAQEADGYRLPLSVWTELQEIHPQGCMAGAYNK
ncbi:MAG: U32 family peptidase [Firmicutes bacterium]|nr:U32 family peptidase [Bacillota bacterium]